MLQVSNFKPEVETSWDVTTSSINTVNFKFRAASEEQSNMSRNVKKPDHQIGSTNSQLPRKHYKSFSPSFVVPKEIRWFDSEEFIIIKGDYSKVINS